MRLLRYFINFQVEILRNAICYIESLEALLSSAEIRFPNGVGTRRAQEERIQVSRQFIEGSEFT